MYQVHKLVLAAQSSVFHAMFEVQMTESQNEEMIIEDMSLNGVKLLMKYIYAGIIDDEWRKVPEEFVNAAEKYDLPILKDFLDHNLHTTLTTENALSLLKVSKTYGLVNATNNISNFIKSNTENIIQHF